MMKMQRLAKQAEQLAERAGGAVSPLALRAGQGGEGTEPLKVIYTDLILVATLVVTLEVTLVVTLMVTLMVTLVVTLMVTLVIALMLSLMTSLM